MPALRASPIRITDGQGTASANVALNVSALAPLARNDNDFVTNENNALSLSASTLLANDSDPSGLPMSIAGVSNPTNGTVSYDANANTITFVPNAGYAGSASFKYSVTDCEWRLVVRKRVFAGERSDDDELVQCHAGTQHGDCERSKRGRAGIQVSGLD